MTSRSFEYLSAAVPHFCRLFSRAVIALTLFSSCEDAFDIHPYDVDYSGPLHLNAAQITRIEQSCADKDTIRVAVISDTHDWYTEMEREIDDINRRDDIDFVMHLGDLTNTGMIKEYEWARKRLLRLQKPFVTIIGNHDHLGTGDEAYDAIFGERDFSFIAGRIKFLCLNTNAGEYDYMADVPDFSFIQREAVRDSSRFDRTFVAMHIPPFCDQFNNNVSLAFRVWLDLLPGLYCCAFGHNHRTYADTLYHDGLVFYGVGSAEKRQYRIFTFTPDKYAVEVVDF
ncbi:MAG: hypothetical protein AUK63_1308 [bacterium P3]|nr:MAG: hypothetical protein AUK63_1308 [bacterium P3]KWW40416.1 MAG: hypothetical protein F083_1653 [bacterium F083]